MSKQTWIPGENGDSGAVIQSIIDSNFTELYNRDASGYGFLTTASASVNTAALQAALDIGGIITIRTPGSYELNDTLYIGSNTKLICCPGVIFKKTGNYSNVLVNKGALTRTWDEDIEIDGITIEVNGVDNITTLDVPGLRAQIGFFYVKHLTFKNFKIEDLGSSQYAIQIVRWYNVYFKNITIEGEKDGLDIGVGNNGLFEDINFTTHDDAIALFGAGYPSVTMEVGDVYNITFRNCNDYIKDGVGYSCRIMTGSWSDWSNGNTYQTGDICSNGGNIYICNNENGFSDIAANAPTHTSGDIAGADGIIWRFCNTDSIHSFNVYNITFDNCNYFDVRAPVDVRWIDSIWTRSVYPGTETQSYVKDIRIVNCTFDGPNVIVQNTGNLKNTVINNCIINDMSNVIYSDNYGDDTNPQWDIIFHGNHLNNTSSFFMNNKRNGQLMNVVAAGNSYYNSSFVIHIQGTSTARLINFNLPIPHADLADLSPEVGDLCMTVNGLNIYKAAGWTNLAT
jgi:hypothetical protein